MQYKWVQHKSQCVGGCWDHSSTTVSLFNSKWVWSFWSCHPFFFFPLFFIRSRKNKLLGFIQKKLCKLYWKFMLLLYTIYGIQAGIKVGWLYGLYRFFYQRRNRLWLLGMGRTLSELSPDWCYLIQPNFCFRINTGGPG